MPPFDHDKEAYSICVDLVWNKFRSNSSSLKVTNVVTCHGTTCSTISDFLGACICIYLMLYVQMKTLRNDIILCLQFYTYESLKQFCLTSSKDSKPNASLSTLQTVCPCLLHIIMTSPLPLYSMPMSFSFSPVIWLEHLKSTIQSSW